MTRPNPNDDVSYVEGDSPIEQINELTPAAGDFLVYDATNGWENKTVAQVKTILGIS
jgi:hypothetical protein